MDKQSQEESQERIKNSWLSFRDNGVNKTSLRGVSKRSIFATPDSFNGKVLNKFNFDNIN